MFRSFQIIIRKFPHSLLKLLHIHDLVRFCKQGFVAAYHDAYGAHLANCTLYNRFLRNMICCHNNLFTKSSSLRHTPIQLHSLQQIDTQHDMLPQYLVYKK